MVKCSFCDKVLIDDGDDKVRYRGALCSACQAKVELALRDMGGVVPKEKKGK